MMQSIDICANLHVHVSDVCMCAYMYMYICVSLCMQVRMYVIYVCPKIFPNMNANATGIRVGVCMRQA